MGCDWCPRCGKLVFDFDPPHVCPPRWEVWCHDHGESREDAHIVYAADSEEAAEKWARDDDAEGDYCIIGGSEVTVSVAKEGDGAVTTYVVEGEMVAEYHAREVKDDQGEKASS